MSQATLESTTAEFCRLYQQARRTRQGSVNALRLHAATLEKFFHSVQDEAQRAGNSAARLAFEKLDALLAVDDAVELSQFFLNVSHSLVEAQDELNRLSSQYSSAQSPVFPPAQFAIPSVHAEMKVGIRDLSERGVNLVLFKDKTESENYAESTISFDLVATPPLPGAKPVFPPALTGDAKAALLGNLRQLAAASSLGELGAELGKKIYANTQPDAAVLRYPPQGASERFLVLWPGRNENETDSPDGWRTLLLFAVEVTASGQASPIADIFEGPQPPPFLLLTSLAELSQKTPADLAALAIRLGDALVNAASIVRQWLEPPQRP